jgi:hypothetical protein
VIFYQCGVIDAIKDSGATQLLMEQRASFISVATLVHMKMMEDKELVLTDVMKEETTFKPNLLKRLNVPVSSYATGIINQYIMLLENLGQAFEIKAEEKKKRRRVVKGINIEEGKGSEEKVVKKKVKTEGKGKSD